MKVIVIRTSGEEETHDIELKTYHKQLEELLGASTFDTVNLRDGRIMYVDDNGYETKAVEHSPSHIELKPIRARKPVNEKGTKLYHSVCRPGTTQQIVGDVAIVRDADFGDD